MDDLLFGKLAGGGSLRVESPTGVSSRVRVPLSRAARLRGAELVALLAVFAALASPSSARPRVRGAGRAVPSPVRRLPGMGGEAARRARRQGGRAGRGHAAAALLRVAGALAAPAVRARPAPGGRAAPHQPGRLPAGGRERAGRREPNPCHREAPLQFYQVAPEIERLRALRYATLPFGLAAVALVYAAMRRASDSRPLALLAASLFGLVPQIVFVSSYLNNDAATAALGAAALWLFVHCALRGPSRRDYLAAALLFASGAATKLSTLPVLAVTCAALPLLDARALRERARDVGLAAALELRRGAAGGLEPGPLRRAHRHRRRVGVGGGAHRALRLRRLVAYFTHYYAIWTFSSYWAASAG